MSAEIEHGGALDKAVARFGGRPQDWLDLSTGINPEHFPLPELTPEIWNRLPDEGLLQETLRLARSYYRLNEKAPIVAAPGTQALIQLVPTLIAPSTVAILGPTYQEHAASFAASGWKVVQCVTLDEIPSEATAAVIVNPNNPDGRVISKEALLQLAQKLGARGGFLVVDEAFADAHEAVTIAANAEDAPMIVLKSFGKFFGLAGVRLGFAITGGRFVEALERRLGPWAVSGPALAIANHAFSDAGTLADYRTRIDLRRAELSAVLDKSGLRKLAARRCFLSSNTRMQSGFTPDCARDIF